VLFIAGSIHVYSTYFVGLVFFTWASTQLLLSFIQLIVKHNMKNLSITHLIAADSDRLAPIFRKTVKISVQLFTTHYTEEIYNFVVFEYAQKYFDHLRNFSHILEDGQTRWLDPPPINCIKIKLMHQC